jgi:hypothetical protein
MFKEIEEKVKEISKLDYVSDVYLDDDCLSEGYLSIQIELKEDIQNDKKALEKHEFPIIEHNISKIKEYIRKWIEEYKVNEIYFHYDTWEDSNHNPKIMFVLENSKIGGDYFNSIKFKTNYTSTLEIPKELDSLAGSKMPVEEFKEKFLK